MIQKISVNEILFQNIKKDCIAVYSGQVQDNDYRLITLAITENVDYLVSNDFKLLTVAKEYKKSKLIAKNKVILMNISGLFWLMHKERKDLFGWKSHVRMNLKFYHQIEIENTCDGIKNRNWNENFAKTRFQPYHNNILNAIDQVGERS